MFFWNENMAHSEIWVFCICRFIRAEGKLNNEIELKIFNALLMVFEKVINK